MSISKRADLLAGEFQRFGMAKPAADTLTSEMLLRHPLAHRVGVPKLARRFARLGLAEEDATRLALTVWCLERLVLGGCYKDLVDTLRRAGVADWMAIPASIEARRLWLAGGERHTVDPDLRLARWCVALLATLVVAQLLQLFAS